jgi:hypothetical protein
MVHSIVENRLIFVKTGKSDGASFNGLLKKGRLNLNFLNFYVFFKKLVYFKKFGQNRIQKFGITRPVLQNSLK